MVVAAMIQNTIFGKQAVRKIAIRNLDVANKSSKNKTVIKNNPHGSYLI